MTISRAAMDALRRDAERYRWLRDYPSFSHPTQSRSELIECQYSTDLDEAIDAAMNGANVEYKAFASTETPTVVGGPLPCPFCGGTVVHVSEPTCNRDTPYNPADRAFPIVHCDECGAQANGENWDKRSVTAIAAWNRRVLSTPALREVTDEDVRAARHAYNSAVILNGSDAREWIRAALESFRARLSTAQGVEARLWDSQWVNIVNHADCWKDYSKERAVNDAVEMTEKAMAKNIRDGFPPAKSAPEAP